ncbi:ABC transporter ATP-binding protein [Magnetospirillum sulfuroxidans]|uniref:ABC transporter ATP-binding protein n=1 Tax=Magnetospirillum sulfuroxidans TaxID=611300 RepID=A0ABS5IJ88_9PROT|nr:ABC transporter ATP-binding protein [Magnetospirillum sulfuroxidans]MBR9973773.1 ABC transporter ATP-binding protein [Magnetospirillum sulfuroxidans]
MTILEARALSVTLDHCPVLSHVSLSVGTGEMLGLIGPNGAGKSTLLRALAGLIPAEGGFLEGHPIRSFAPKERARRLAYLPQGSDSHWPMAAREVVALGRTPHHGGKVRLTPKDHDSITRAMAEADVEALADRPMNRLSGGERARVLLARALAVGAPVLMADEPAAHLDVGHQLSLMQVLRRRAEGGDTVVLVLHDLSSALRFCDRVAVLAQGRLVAQGNPAEVLSDACLAQVFGIAVARGRHEGVPFFQPWSPVRQGA